MGSLADSAADLAADSDSAGTNSVPEAAHSAEAAHAAAGSKASSSPQSGCGEGERDKRMRPCFRVCAPPCELPASATAGNTSCLGVGLNVAGVNVVGQAVAIGFRVGPG